MMVRTSPFCLILVAALCQQLCRADEPVFSGPQVGEPLAPFTMKAVVGDQAGAEIEPIALAKGGPLVIVFFHNRTRPAFALTNTVMRMAASRKKDGLASVVCFVADDATATEDWMRRVRQHFAPGVTHGISTDGPEGPGAYGLNRNVTVTVLIGKDNKVTANFALVQPSLQADGPKIFEAIVEALGGGPVPQLAEFSQNRYGQVRRLSPQLQKMLRPLLSREATPEEVQKAAQAIEKHLADNPRDRAQVGRTATQLVRSSRVESIGTEPARAKIREWARKFGRRPAARKKKES